MPTTVFILISALLPASISYLYPKFSLFFSPRSGPAFVPASMPALISHLRSPAFLISRCVPAPTVFIALLLPCYAPIIHLGFTNLLSSCFMPTLIIFCCNGLAFLLLLLTRDLLILPESSTLKTFKQLLSDKLWPCMLTSPAKLLCLLPAFVAYKLDNNNKCKQNFDTVFINSHSLAGNHNQEKMDLSFVGRGCLDTIILSWS